jgi:Ni/Co efflux regulator RcnB
MKLPVLALCTMLSAFAIPATADTLQLRTAEFNGAPGQSQTLLFNGDTSDAQLVKRKHRHHNHRNSGYRYRGHHHRHGYYYRPYYRPYYYRPYYYDPYRYSYPRSGFYFRIF